MDPPIPNPPSPAKVRVSAGEPTLSRGNPVEAVPGGQPPRRERRKLLQFGLLALLCAGLVGLSTWWLLSRRGEGRAGVPDNAIALINSSTPIPVYIPDSAKDSVGDLLYAPDSQAWSQAVRQAQRAQDEGRYSSAISQYSALVGSGTPSQARDALWGLASAYAASDQPDLAIRSYSLFASLDDPRSVRALFKLGQLYEQTGRKTQAIQAYADYGNHSGPARHGAQLLQASLLGSTPDAEKVYKAIFDDKDKPQDADLRDTLSGWAAVKSNLGDHVGAKELYDRLAAEQKSRPREALDRSSDSPQAQAADEIRLAGDTAGARKRLLDYLREGGGYPAGRYSALDALLKLDPSAVISGTISPMQAASIAYDAGYYGKAIGHLDTLRTLSPGSPQLAAASLMTGKAYDSSGDPASAYNWYTATVQTYPMSPQAPEALRRAGDALEEQASWDAALGAYRQATVQYPNAGEQTAIARINGGVLAYRLEQRDMALDLLRPVLSSQELSPTLKAGASFWAGKVEKSMGDSAWKRELGQASSLAPGSFFDFRARSLLKGEPDGGPVTPTFSESYVLDANLGVSYDTEAGERKELLGWASSLPVARAPVSGTATVATSTPITLTGPITVTETIEPRLAQDPELRWAVALLNLGYEPAAYVAFRALSERLQREGDARGLAQLVIYLRYHADTRTAMRVAETLSQMSSGDPFKQPKLLLKTLYPTPYAPLIMDEAKQRDIDPLVLYALMRQESQFVPDARSHADARGLTQVIPSTGQGVAEQLGDTRFTANDLYLPYLNIRYGTYYLASNLPQFDRKLLPTLAAYNGGPGNAARWLSGSALLDPDLYGQRIDLFETEDYLERVYQNYGFYRQVYGGE